MERILFGYLRRRVFQGVVKVGSEWYPDWGVAAIGFDLRGDVRNGVSSLTRFQAMIPSSGMLR